jgi:DNA-3-methyladenine glycosylase II
VSTLAIPQPYDFEHSTERFRLFGSDRVTVWHEGALHRVFGGNEVRVEPAPSGVRVDPSGPRVERRVAFLLGLSFDLATFWEWARGDEVLAKLAEPLVAYRPPLAPDPWEALVTAITAQQVSLSSATAVRGRFVERFGDAYDLAWSFPRRELVANARVDDLASVGFSRRKAEYVLGLAQSELDLDALSVLADEEVVQAITSVRGLGRWTADWFLARALGRADAWPAGDLGLRKAVSRFYGGGRMLSEEEVRVVGERFAGHRNLVAQVLLTAARLYG